MPAKSFVSHEPGCDRQRPGRLRVERGSPPAGAGAGSAGGLASGEATAHINIGQCVLERGDIAAALVWADEAFELARQIEERTIMARSFLLRADACEAARDPPAALAALEGARTRFEAVGAAPHVAITSVLIAEHCRLADDLSRAVAEVNRVLLALAGGVSLDGTGEELRVRHLCVKVLQATGDARGAAARSLARRLAGHGGAHRRRGHALGVPGQRASASRGRRGPGGALGAGLSGLSGVGRTHPPVRSFVRPSARSLARSFAIGPQPSRASGAATVCPPHRQRQRHRRHPHAGSASGRRPARLPPAAPGSAAGA